MKAALNVDIIIVNDLTGARYCKLFSHAIKEDIPRLDEYLRKNIDPEINVRYVFISRYRRGGTHVSLYKNSKDLYEGINVMTYNGCDTLEYIYDNFYLAPVEEKDYDLYVNYKSAIDTKGLRIRTQEGAKEKAEWLVSLWSDYITNPRMDWGYKTEVSDFWDEENLRLVVYNTDTSEAEYPEERRNPKYMNELKIGERYISEDARHNQITFVNVSGIDFYSKIKLSLDSNLFQCNIVPFYDTDVGIFSRHPISYLVFNGRREYTPKHIIAPFKVSQSSFGRDPADDIPLTYSECIGEAVSKALYAYAIMPRKIDVAEEIRARYGHRVPKAELSNKEIKMLLDNPYEDIFENKNKKYIRTQAPNIFSFGKYDPLRILYTNKMKVHKPYPNEVATKATDEDAKQIIINKIELTSDLLSGGNSFIECAGLIYANKFLSNAYTVARNYIEENISTLPLRTLLRPMYIEPVFIISAAQAAYCTLIRDEYSILRHKFMNPHSERCPFVYVIMYATYEKIEPVVGLPLPKINIEIRFDACEDRPNELTWVPKKSCVSPDPFALPFGLRTSLKNMRVLNIMDIIKSEQNVRNINYSLSRQTRFVAKPDHLCIYTCEAKKCETHLLKLLGPDAIDTLNPYSPKDYSIYEDSPKVDSPAEACPLDQIVLPSSYSEFNIRPFVPATEEELIKIGSTDADHVYTTMPHGGINRREESLEYGLWDLVTPNPNRHKYITDIASDMSQYNVDNCYSRLWAFNYTMNGRADFESPTINESLLRLSKILPINGRPLIGMSYSPFIDDVM